MSNAALNETKVCTVCCVEKPLDCFGIRSDAPNKAKSNCKRCDCERMRFRASKFPGYNAERAKRNRAKNGPYPKPFVPAPTVDRKKCARCKAVKEAGSFPKSVRSNDGLYHRCKECVSHTGKRRYQDPDMREKVLESQKQYRIDYPERRKASQRLYKANNKEKINRYNSTPQQKIRISMRSMMQARLGRKPHGTGSRMLRLLGIESMPELRAYLESKFRAGMTWENHGRYGWHIDHIKPLSTFDLLVESEASKAFHYTNLQPLWWYENLSKGNRIQS